MYGLYMLLYILLRIGSFYKTKMFYFYFYNVNDTIVHTNVIIFTYKKKTFR